jgi:hypothetical protein
MSLAKIPPTAKQKRTLMLHAVVFVIVNIILWLPWITKTDNSFLYPWPIWVTSAWFLSLIGHWAALFTRVEDAGMDKYHYDATH